MNNQEAITKLLEQYGDSNIESVVEMPITASNRKYYRVFLKGNVSLIAVNNEDVRENEAFLSFAEALGKTMDKFPKVLAVSSDKKWYLQNDLGDTTLFSFLEEHQQDADFKARRTSIYKSVIQDLIQIQTEGYQHINFDKAYPRPAFDRQAITWDLSYFKYYFLKLSGLNFDEELLEQSFHKLIDLLTQVPSYFMYRDFQSRNIMLSGDKLYYIDFQSGRKGALQYDLASLLFDAKANLDSDFRLQMLDYYYDNLPNEIQNHQSDFKQNFWLFALVRIMQAMGAYGYRGLFEKKQHFIKSIPLALRNLDTVLEQIHNPQLKYLTDILSQLKTSAYLQSYLPNKQDNKLTVYVGSFSFKKGLPKDKSDNGGGFIFDCRAIHNPGRYEAYKQLTGKDKAVQDFFLATPSMDLFLSQVYDMIDASVRNYIERGFESLMVSFGCTGGQHRSVYSAEKLTAHLKEKFNINVELSHREIGEDGELI